MKKINMIKKIFKILFYILISLFLMIFLFNFCLAALDTGLQYGQGTQLPSTDIRMVIGNIIKNVFGFLALVFVILILISGFLYMTSRDNPEKTAKAKKIIISAVIGLVIMLSSYSITLFVLRIFTGPPYISGDANGNGIIGPEDLSLIRAVIIGDQNTRCYDRDNKPIDCKVVADINHDGVVNNDDLELAKKIISGQ